MIVTLREENFHPTPTDFAEEFWESDAETQAEILYAMALIYDGHFAAFCKRMYAIRSELHEDERKLIINMLEQLIFEIG